MNDATDEVLVVAQHDELVDEVFLLLAQEVWHLASWGCLAFLQLPQFIYFGVDEFIGGCLARLLALEGDDLVRLHELQELFGEFGEGLLGQPLLIVAELVERHKLHDVPLDVLILGLGEQQSIIGIQSTKMLIIIYNVI